VIRGVACLVMAGCGAVAAPPPSPSGPTAWRLVEEDGLLVLEAFDGGAGLLLEVRFSGEVASVGERVEARVRMPGAEGIRRVEVSPDGPGVTIDGPSILRLEGSRPATVRFTRVWPGRGGLILRVLDQD
jgi:hypothetical protein